MTAPTDPRPGRDARRTRRQAQRRAERRARRAGTGARSGEALALTLAEGRTCGDCSACCEVPGIETSPSKAPELAGVHPGGKPRGTPCAHLAGGTGCRIYAGRPPLCRAYACGYLLGLVSGRPGGSQGAGLLVEVIVDAEERLFCSAAELWPGASSEAAGVRTLAEVAAAMNRSGGGLVHVLPHGADYGRVTLRRARKAALRGRFGATAVTDDVPEAASDPDEGENL